MLPKVDQFGEYKLSGATLNRLIDAANSWENLRVELIVSSEDVTRLIRGAAGATLRIVVPPPASSGYEEVELEFCHPTLGNATATFLIKDAAAIA